MKKILAEISIGELLDKLTILEIKLKKITDTSSIGKIEKEFKSLKEIDLGKIDVEKYKSLYES